ncbi:MAG: 50S ribosomal protein L11 methyltransferase [Gammaproteobacteria bacterium]|nr:50S ribosomal protein L11 methyltransferase [Gammaproteobacteria bacterium]
MAWTQIKFQVTADQADDLVAALEAEGALSVTLADAGDEPQYQSDPLAAPLWRATWVTGLFAADRDPAAVVDGVAAGWSGTLPDPVVECLPDQEWELAWKDGFEALYYGNRLWVVPNWLEPPDPRAVNIRMDPGLAFGTGTHPTTALCLEWLDRRDLDGARVVDYGCGSGILAIAALRLGAAQAWATDIDSRAMDATADNARHNGVAHRLHVTAPLEIPGGSADVVVANILAGPLVDLVPTLEGLLAPAGTLLLSGLLEEQMGEVEAAYAPRLEPTARLLRDGWALLVLKRREAGR